MIPDKQPNEEFVAFGIRWTPGARKLVLYVAVAAFSGSVWLGWDKLAQLLSSAPVWAIVAVLGIASMTSHVPAYAANNVQAPEAVFSLSTDYEQTRGIFQP